MKKIIFNLFIIIIILVVVVVITFLFPVRSYKDWVLYIYVLDHAECTIIIDLILRKLSPEIASQAKNDDYKYN